MNRLRKPRTKKAADNNGPDLKTPCQPSNTYGCISWQPDLPENETEDTLEEMRTELILLQQDPNRSAARIDTIMRKSYYLQWTIIIKGHAVQDVQEMWPFLFWQRWLCLHFKLLTGKPAYTLLLKAFEKRGEAMRKFFSHLAASGGAKKAVRTALMEIEAATQHTDSDVQAPTLVYLVMAQLNEKLDNLILLADVSMMLSTIVS